MRIIAISLCAFALTAAPALAMEGNPVSGTGVSIESSPGGFRAPYHDMKAAEDACRAAGGTFSNTAGKLVCSNPRKPLAGAAIGKSSSNIKRPPGVITMPQSNETAPPK